MLPPNLRTLVVDDNQTDRLIVRRMLERMGLADVQVAEDGTIAESKLLTAEQINRPFQLVVLDWNMPGANGLKILQFIRRSKLTKSAKVVVMTATADITVVEAAVASGANDFIVKPVAAATLSEKLLKIHGLAKNTP